MAVGNRCHGLAISAVFGSGSGLLHALADVGVEDALAETDVERGGFDEFVGIDVFDGALERETKRWSQLGGLVLAG